MNKGSMRGAPRALALLLAAAAGMLTSSAEAANGTLALSSSSYSISQTGGSLTVRVSRAGSTTSAATVKYATSDSTAKAGTDYTASSGTLSWAANDAAFKAFTVPVSSATLFYGTRTFKLSLSAPTGATLTSPYTATVSITGTGKAGTLTMAAGTASVAQNAGSVLLQVTRSGGADVAVSVKYATSDGTAVAGADYTGTNSGVLKWAAGDTAAKTLSVPISNYSPFLGSKTFAVTLGHTDGGATVGSQNRTVVTINGDMGPGALAFSGATFSAAQGGSAMTVTVGRSGGVAGAATVHYDTSDSTAHAGTDYTAASGTLSWANADGAAKSFQVPIAAGTPFSGIRSFKLTLSAPTGATLGTQGTATGSINGTSGSGTLEFSNAAYSVAQGAGTITVTVQRSGSSGAVSVKYSSSDGTAVAGADFTAAAGTLNWASGDSAAKTFTVPVSNAVPFIGSKAFTLNLSNNGGGAQLGSPSRATVTINGGIADLPSLQDAVRFLEQSSFGPTDSAIAAVQQIGLTAYLNQQFSAPITGYPNFQSQYADNSVCHGSNVCLRDNYSPFPVQMRFFQNALTGNDQLRQRVAFALGQIFVVSGNKSGITYGVGDYQQLLLKDAFGNYRQLLNDVTLSPLMGNYLDMANNDKQNGEAAPNENYAREVMQLFSIGTVLLNADGTHQLDGSGNTIPTYDQDTVEGFAHVFTGWTYPASPRTASVQWTDEDWYRGVMQPVAAHHDTGTKKLLSGVTLPANQAQNTDLQQALDNIFNHPNVGPFICKQLIQFLVTSNPQPAYVARVVAVFNNNGSGVRGDLKAVVRAILLDAEARGSTKTDTSYGKLREPVLYITGILRGLGGNTQSDGEAPALFAGSGLSQDLFNAPSVFNFYPPDYPLTGTSLVAPPLAIYNTNSGLNRANLVNQMLQPPYSVAADGSVANATGTTLDLGAWIGVAGTTAALLNKINRIYFHNTMSNGLTSIITQVVDGIPAAQRADRAQAALYLALTSAEYQVEQ